MIKFKSLNQNSEFLRILKRKRLNTKYFTIYFNKNSGDLKKKRLNTKYFTIYFNKNSKNSNKNLDKYLNISFVMKKKIGNSVKRNKIKRKLKYAVQKISKEKQIIDLNYTYVIFGKNNVYKDKFANIFYEVNKTFKKIKQINH